MKKKLLAIMLIAVMVLGMNTTAMAEEVTYDDMSTVTITKTYNKTNEGTTSPAETFTFSALTCTGVTNAAVGVTAETAPVPTIASVDYAAGEAGSATAAKNITITLPTYTGVGIYTYTFTEVAGNTAGVKYYEDKITLVVTVIEQNGKVRVAAVHTEGEGEAKSDDFANEYSAGSLIVGKTVTGILGDKTKDFTVKVKFTAPAGKEVKETIIYGNETITKNEWVEGVAEVEIALADAESITFKNIPYGVTYTVVENDYTADGYTATYNFGDEDKTINTTSDEVQITNHKDGNVDTGLIINNMPYIVMLALVAGAVVLFAMNRRRRVEF